MTVTVVTGSTHFAYIANNGDSKWEATVNASAALPLMPLHRNSNTEYYAASGAAHRMGNTFIRLTLLVASTSTR